VGFISWYAALRSLPATGRRHNRRCLRFTIGQSRIDGPVTVT
jgi:hypothetical protein